MNSTIPADLLELRARFETWRANRKYVREPIPRGAPLGGESEQSFFVFFTLRFRKHTIRSASFVLAHFASTGINT